MFEGSTGPPAGVRTARSLRFFSLTFFANNRFFITSFAVEKLITKPYDHLKDVRQCLVLTYSLIRTSFQARQELANIKAKLDAMNRVQFGIPGSIDWDIYFVLTTSSLMETIEEMTGGIFTRTDNINLNIVILQPDEPQRFNKFTFVKHSIAKFSDYSYILMADSDMSFESFPWERFWTQTVESKSVITSSLRQSVVESVRGANKNRLWFQIFDSRPWKIKTHKVCVLSRGANDVNEEQMT